MSRPAIQILPQQLEEARVAFTTEGPNKTAHRFGISPNTFRRVAKEQGWISPREVIIAARPVRTQDEIDEIIQREYPTKGRRLAHELQYSEEKIRDDAVRLGVTTPRGEVMAANRSTLKLEYFLSWSAPMAYDLGFIFADGATQLNKRKKPHQLLLHQKTSDEEVILGIRERLGSHHHVRRYEKIQKSGTISPMTMIGISSQQLTQSLIDHGVLPGKSYRDIPFPYVPEAFIQHFTRGVFDGDGCVGHYRYLINSRWAEKNIFYILGSHRFIQGQYERLINAIPTLSKLPPKPRKRNPTISIIQWQDPSDLTKIARWLYPPGRYPFLARKKFLMEGI